MIDFLWHGLIGSAVLGTALVALTLVMLRWYKTPR